MLTGHRFHRYAYADCAALERESPAKHESLDGEIYAMGCCSVEHSALAAQVQRALGNAIGDRPCRVHTSDLRIYVEATGVATFPDGAVICGRFEQHVASPTATALNPSVHIEVTSDPSEEYDTGTKLASYRTIPSLRECIILSHRERRIVVHRRDEHGVWVAEVAITGGRVGVPSLNALLLVDEIDCGSAIA